MNKALCWTYWIALSLTIIGALNWLGIAIAGEDGNVVQIIFKAKGARIVYGIVGAAAIITLALSIFKHAKKTDFAKMIQARLGSSSDA